MSRWLPALLLTIAAASAVDPWPTSAGTVGGTQLDEFFCTAILSNGQVLVQGRLNSGTLPVTPVLVGGASATAAHVILKFAADGRSIVGACRLPTGPTGAIDGSPVNRGRIAVGSNDVIWVGGSGGLYCLNSDFSLRWSNTNYVERVCADGDYGAAICDSSMQVWNKDGVVQGTLSAPPCPDGTLLIRCMAIDAVNQLVFIGGYRQTYGNNSVDVQVPWLQAQHFNGTQAWMDYNWPGLTVDPDGMADTRTVQLCIGADRKLYAGFHVEGGNTPLNFQPRSWGTASNPVGGGVGWYTIFARTASEIKSAVGRYDPVTGNLLKLQYLSGRVSSAANAVARRVAITNGGIAAAADGSVYLVGDAYSATDATSTTVITNTVTGHTYTMDAQFQLTDNQTGQIYTGDGSDISWVSVTNPGAGTVLPYGSDLAAAYSAYGGGGFLIKLDPNFAITTCTRLVTGAVPSNQRDGNTMALRDVAVRGTTVAVCGIYLPPSDGTGLWTAYPVQAQPGGAGDGYYAIQTTVVPGNAAPGINHAAQATPASLVLP
jgi:hypothetical protein